MRALINSWHNWYNNKLDVSIDMEMGIAMLEILDTAISVAVSENDYTKAKVLIEDRVRLNDYLTEKQLEEDNVERESSEND